MPNNDATSSYTARRTIQPGSWYHWSPVGIFTQPSIPTGQEVHTDFISHYPGYVHDVPQQPLAGIIDNHRGEGAGTAVQKTLPPEPIVFSGDANGLTTQAEEIGNARRLADQRQGTAMLYTGAVVATAAIITACVITAPVIVVVAIVVVAVAAVALAVFGLGRLCNWW